MSVDLSPSIPSPAPLGTPVTWTATVSGVDPGTLSYRFRTRLAGEPFHTVVDFGPSPNLSWTTIEQEGSYEMEAAVKNSSTGEIAAMWVNFVFSPLATGSAPVITRSSNPLVYIFSEPGCMQGRMHVSFTAPDGTVQNTSDRACLRGHTMNFYLAGMQPNTQYTASHVLSLRSGTSAGPSVTFTTGAASLPPPKVSMLASPGPAEGGLLLQSLFLQSSIATDLNGNVLWYTPSDLSYLTRAQDGGTFMGVFEDGSQDTSHQFFREFDLAGMTVAETNAARVNEQLAAMNASSITGFHHEARKLPNGNYLVLAGTERLLTNVQGPGTVDVLGDMILVLDRDLNVLWTWNAFDHLDATRMAPLKELCNYPSTPACPPIYLAKTANDWTHGNALQLAPDGNILYSVRNQDWIVKIDYRNGSGSGNILWRIGIEGDFAIQSTDPSPWFSHQHDANFESNGTSLMVFDDGNQRAAINPSIHSRGQQLQIDERNRVATLVLNADLGTYSQALGSAQALPNGNFHFDSGFIYVLDSSGKLIGTNAQSIETDASGNVLYAIQFAAPEYRSFRMRDLYTAP